MSMAGIFSFFLFLTCVYNLGRMPSPIFSKKLNKLEKIKEEKIEEEKIEEEEEFDNNRRVDYMYGNQENLKFKILEKNKKFKGSVRREASQYFFYTCQSDGKQRISFTYPPSLSTFGEMIARRISF